MIAKRYIDQRRLKIFKFPKKSNKQINKWLSRRMLRGSSLKYGFNISLRSLTLPLKKAAQRWPGRKFNALAKSLKIYKYSRHIINKRRGSVKFNKRWWVSRIKLHPVLNVAKLSYSVGNVLNCLCNITAVNVFNYLASKQMLGFRSHQEHL